MGKLVRPTGRRRKLPGEEYLFARGDSPSWWVAFTIDGQRVRESTGTADWERAAAYAASRYDACWRALKLGEVPERHLTVTEAFARFWEEVAKGTPYGEQAQKFHLARLRLLLGKQLRLADLDDDAVAHAVAALRNDGASPATCNRYIHTLSSVTRRAAEVWGVKVGGWKRSVHLQKEPEGREIFLSQAQARRVMDNCIPHLRPFLALELLTGLRKGNLCGLQWEMIDWDGRTATMRQKGDRKLTIQLDEIAMALLQQLQPEPEFRHGPVFRYGNPHVPCTCAACAVPGRKLIGRPFKNPKRSIATAFRLAKVPAGTRFHDLRHTFASWLLREERNLKVVQQALGHAKIDTTTRYAHLLGDEVRRGVRGVAASLFRADDMPALPAPEKKRGAA